ncbi:MAG: hypothetical protein ACTSRU_16315 [Candidatus Hodarchaeales archaeon]
MRMKLITRRIGNIITFGNSLYLGLRQEFVNLGLDVGDSVVITLEESDDGNRMIVIEKLKQASHKKA